MLQIHGFDFMLDFVEIYVRIPVLNKQGNLYATLEFDRVLEEIFDEMETSDLSLADRVAEGWVRRQSMKIRSALEEGPFTEAGAKAWRRASWKSWPGRWFVRVTGPSRSCRKTT